MVGDPEEPDASAVARAIRRTWSQYAQRIEPTLESIDQGIVHRALRLESLLERRGLRVLQPLCGTGHELRSLERSTWASGVGVDFTSEFFISSDPSVTSRISLVDSEIYEFLHTAKSSSYDWAFTTYGSIWWLRDLSLFSSQLRRVVRDGGVYSLVDFHPATFMLSRQGAFVDDMPANSGYIRVAETFKDYRGFGADVAGLVPYYTWGTSQLVSAFLSSGWRLTAMNEEYEVQERLVDRMEPTGEHLWVLPSPKIPATLTLRFEAT